MYTHHLDGVGQAPTPNQPSLFSSIVDLAKTGVQAGFNIYSNIQNLTQSKQQTQVSQQALQQVRQYAPQPGYPLQPGYPPQQGPAQYRQPATGFLDNWGLPLLLGGGAILLFTFLKK